MTVYRMWDAIEPPKQLPAGYQAAAGYIGGDAFRVWTPEDWRRVAEAELAALPIWVRSNPAGHAEGTADGRACVARLMDLGVPEGCPVVLDRETSVSLAYVEGFAFMLEGWRLLEYGSPRDLFLGAGQPWGFWPANPTGHLHWDPEGLPYDRWPGPVHAVQCIWGQEVNTSALGPHALARLWHPGAAA